MADPGPSQLSDGKNMSKRKLKNTAENESDDLSPPKTSKTDVPLDITQMISNTSGIKSFLHGVSYQIKLCLFVILVNAKKSLESQENGEIFNYTVTTEDVTAGKFDDIVNSFLNGEKTGRLNIQAKHTSKTPTRKIKVYDLTTTSKKDNFFAIPRYFTSFCDQKQSPVDVEGLIICTNWDIDNDAEEILKAVEPPGMNNSTASLDANISTLFERIGGKSYRLDYDKIWTPHGRFSYFHDLLRKCSKRARLAGLLIENIKSNGQKKITRGEPLFKEHRSAILHIIGKVKTSKKFYEFSEEFINPSSSKSIPGYEAFRNEFEEQYRKEFSTVGSVCDDLKTKHVCVAEAFMSDGKDQSSSNASFPQDNVDKSFESFCDKFRIVCGTKSDDEIDDLIVNIWRDIHSNEDHSGLNEKGLVEENAALNNLFVQTFNWMKDKNANVWNSNHMKEVRGIINNAFAFMRLRGISQHLQTKLVKSQFRIRKDVLQKSLLKKSKCFFAQEEQIDTIVEIKATDIEFAVTVISDFVFQQGKTSYNIIFLEDFYFIENSKRVRDVFHSIECSNVLIIICNTMLKEVQGIVEKWKKDPAIQQKKKNPTARAKQVFLVKKNIENQSDLKHFRICNLTEESWHQFLGETIPLMGTIISSSKIFQNNFPELPIEELIQLLDRGKQLKENNEISQSYRQIENSYVKRYWSDHNNKLQTESDTFDYTDISHIYEKINELNKEKFCFNDIPELMMKDGVFNNMFLEVNHPTNQQEPILNDEVQKVFILLGEAGQGKSTNLVWLAWHFQKQKPSFWVIRCNLSEFCSEFKPFVQDQNNRDTKVINETEALRLLCKMYCQFEQKNVQNFSKRLSYSDGSAILHEELRFHLLVFQEKFNANELVLFLDGFDEIAPHYKNVVLNFLSMFEKFKGVSKLCLTSRPCFKEQFQNSFDDPSFFQLKPLTMEDKGSMLYKMLKTKLHNENIQDEEVSNLYKSLGYMLLCSLGDMSNIPSNLMRAVDNLMDHVAQNHNIIIDFSPKSISLKLLEVKKPISEAWFILQEFSKIGKRRLLYDKYVANKSVANKPPEIEKMEQAVDELKQLHGIVALLLFFDKSELEPMLLETEIRKVEKFMNDVQGAKDKTGIIIGIHNGVPMFIYRIIAVHLAAWWIVKQQTKKEHQGMLKIPILYSFLNQEELRKHVDIILAKNHPLHLEIIENRWKTEPAKYLTIPKAFDRKDDGNRTLFHLYSFYKKEHFELTNLSDFLPKTFESDVINVKEKIFGWTALDCAFYKETPNLIFYFLHQGATVNIDVLCEQIYASGNPFKKATIYAKFVLGYVCRLAIEYESHEASKNMKIICDTVVNHMMNEKCIDFNRTIDYSSLNTIMLDECREPSDNSVNDIETEYDILKYIIRKDSIFMLQAVIDQVNQEKFFENIKYLLLNYAFRHRAVCVMKYLMKNNPFILEGNDLWKCMVKAVKADQKKEFKFMFDRYCALLNIKDFASCSIRSDAVSPFSNSICFYINSLVDKAIRDIAGKSIFCKILPRLKIDKFILSVLVMCLIAGRSAMLRYVQESCKLELCASLVYWLVNTTGKMLHSCHYSDFNLKSAYACLLNQASNISNVEATNMLRLMIISNNFNFSKCLIEQYNINPQAVQELNGWNPLHLCVSCSFKYHCNTRESRLELFRWMFERTEMDCFSNCYRNERSILHLAVENEYDQISNYIIARKLEITDLAEAIKLRIDALPNLLFCYREVRIISKSVGKEWCSNLLVTIAELIAKISPNIHDESRQDPNSVRLFFEENAEELLQIAAKRRSLFLLYYLHRELRCAIPSSVHDADWLACIAKSFKTSKMLFQWMFDQYCLRHQIAQPKGDEGNIHIDYTNFKEWNNHCTEIPAQEKLKNFVKVAESTLLTNRTQQDKCKIKLFLLAMLMENLSLITYLCEVFEKKMYQKDLLDIMKIAHKINDFHVSTEHILDTIYKLLFKRISNLKETDAEGRNILHCALESGLSCMADFLIKQNMVNLAAVNEQNGWNILHYHVLCKPSCIPSLKVTKLMDYITEPLPAISSDQTEFISLQARRKNILKELCFNHTTTRKSVIHLAVEANNLEICEEIIEMLYGIIRIRSHTITNQEEYLRYIECYDELCQTAAQISFNVIFEKLLQNLAEAILEFSPQTIEHISKQENVDDLVVEDACRTAIMYRSVSTLQYLIVTFSRQMTESLATRTSSELVACMMECIRQNKTSMFKVLVGHYRILHGLQPSVEFEYEEAIDYNYRKDRINERQINWSIVDQVALDERMKRDHLQLFILSVAYGRLSMTQYLDETVQIADNKSLIVLIMKALKNVKEQHYDAVVPVYQYLAGRNGGNLNILHVCNQARNFYVLEYLIKDQHLDPSERDSENGWNAGHYFVSETINDDNSSFAKQVFKLLFYISKIDYFGVYDRNGRNVFDLAIENGHTDIVDDLIQYKLKIYPGSCKPWEDWDMEEIDDCILQLQKIIPTLSSSLRAKWQAILDDVTFWRDVCNTL